MQKDQHEKTKQVLLNQSHRKLVATAKATAAAAVAMHERRQALQDATAKALLGVTQHTHDTNAAPDRVWEGLVAARPSDALAEYTSATVSAASRALAS